jgi:hypothetical protein
MNVIPGCMCDIRSINLYVVASEPSIVNCNIIMYINKIHHCYRPGTDEYGGQESTRGKWEIHLSVGELFCNNSCSCTSPLDLHTTFLSVSVLPNEFKRLLFILIWPSE